MKWGKADFKEFKKLAEQIEKAEKESQEFCESVVKELLARLLAKVIPATPVGDGTLRRGWISGSEGEAQGGGDVSSGEITAYAESVDIRKNGDVYEIEIINPVNHALFKEYGHRTRQGTGTAPNYKPKPGGQVWVEGSFMLTISEQDLKREAPNIIKKKLEKFLKEIMP